MIEKGTSASSVFYILSGEIAVITILSRIERLKYQDIHRVISTLGSGKMVGLDTAAYGIPSYFSYNTNCGSNMLIKIPIKIFRKFFLADFLESNKKVFDLEKQFMHFGDWGKRKFIAISQFIEPVKLGILEKIQFPNFLDF